MPKRMVASLHPNERVVDFFLVCERQLRQKKNNDGCYLAMRLGDRSGTIEARVWEAAQETYQRVQVDDIVKVDARVDLYREELQLSVSKLRLAQENEYDLEDFLPFADRDAASMLNDLDETVQSISNPHLAALLRAVLDEETLASLARAPGAKRIHHAYLGGLLEHILEVIAYCRAAISLQPQLDADLLLCGAILHDLGKLQEYAYQRSIDFTDEGRLIGHITLGHDLIARRAAEIEGFPPDLLLRLRHLILSHHGHYEWQSPKRPKTLEAMVLHLADYFSSQVSIFCTVLKEHQASQSTWTGYSKYLDRSLFIGSTMPLPGYEDEPTSLQSRVMEGRYQGY